MSPFFIVSSFHLRLHKSSELPWHFPASSVPFTLAYFYDLIIVRQKVHVDPHTLVEDPIAHLICLLVPVHLTPWHFSPKSLRFRSILTSVLLWACLERALAPTVSTDIFCTFFSYSNLRPVIPMCLRLNISKSHVLEGGRLSMDPMVDLSPNAVRMPLISIP